MGWVSLAMPEAGAVLAVLAGLLLAAMVARRGAMVRGPVLGLAIALVVLALPLRGTQDRNAVLAADLAICFGLAVLALSTGLRLLPPGLARMARAVGAGWVSIGFQTVLRPLAWRLFACLGIGMVLTGYDFGLAAVLEVNGGLLPQVALLACAWLGLGLIVRPSGARQ
jgi:ABC-type spermidine/putrescine transport system permease subunit II